MDFVVVVCSCEESLDAFINGMRHCSGLMPEHHLPPKIFAALIVLIALLLYGWTAQKRVHSIVPILGMAILALDVVCAPTSAPTHFMDILDAYNLGSSTGTGRGNTAVRETWSGLRENAPCCCHIRFSTAITVADAIWRENPAKL